MSDHAPPPESAPKLDLALCADDDTLRRYETALRYLCVGLIDAAMHVRVITSCPAPDALLVGGVKALQHRPLTWPTRRSVLRRLADTLAEKPPSVVHGFGIEGFEVAAEMARELDAGLVLHVFGLEDIETLQTQSLDGVDRVIAASQPLMDRLLEAQSLLRERCELIRPGLLAGEGPGCFNDPDRTPTVLCTRRLDPYSGVESFLQAVAALRSRGHEFLTFLTGTGPTEPALRRQVRASGLTSHVTFASPSADPREIMAGADVFVQPSLDDYVSIRVLQAMGAGAATVCVAGNMGDACIDGENAIVCPDDRPATLADAIERYLAAPAFARNIASNAMRYVRKHHSVSARCADLLAIYHELALRGRTLSA